MSVSKWLKSTGILCSKRWLGHNKKQPCSLPDSPSHTVLVSPVCTQRGGDQTARAIELNLILMDHYSKVCFNTILMDMGLLFVLCFLLPVLCKGICIWSMFWCSRLLLYVSNTISKGSYLSWRQERHPLRQNKLDRAKRLMWFQLRSYQFCQSVLVPVKEKHSRFICGRANAQQRAAEQPRLQVR